ncbi:MAG: hypothetical protein COA57_06715 [Flavobacteriales bacterium]|nr:MAG: hypothetical protein COA57_06715 [Flavobacteriales bacterium]
MHSKLRILHLIHVLLLIAWAKHPVFAIDLLPVSNKTPFFEISFIDTLKNDTTAVAGKLLKPKKSTLDAKVEYEAKDSILFDVQSQKMYLYGNAVVNYEDTKLEAAYIELSLKNNLMFAQGRIDSAGKYVDKPWFEDAGQGFSADSLKYNFDTKKGKIHEARTQDGDGYVHGKQIKMVEDDILYIKNGKYTTCSHDTPHFHIEATKLKIIKNDKIITGPAYLAVANIPTPLVLPFGYFPNKKGQASGIIIPMYGESPRLGFFLNNGGYYFGLNEYMELSLLGDIYSRGSYALRTNYNYRWKYRFSGNLNLQYANFRESDPEFPDFQESKNFFVTWRHKQDPKSRPNSNFSADVNAGSAANYRNNINSTTNNYLRNTFKSNITYQKNFRIPLIDKNASVTLNASHDQNTQDSSLNVALPHIQFGVNDRIRLIPKGKKQVKERFYNKIALSYNAETKNILKTKEDSTLWVWEKQKKLMQNGFKHQVPITLPTFKLLKYLNFSPRVNYSGVLYPETYRKEWNTDSNRLETDTIPTIEYFHNYSFSADMTTRIYGHFSTRKGGAQLRHVLTPSVGVTFKPDFSDEKFDYYRFYYPTDTDGVVTDSIQYSRFSGIYGSPSKGESGMVRFNLINNLEMKVRSKKDTISGFKKIKLLENFSLSTSYNILADSLNWAPIKINGWTNLFKSVNLRFTSSHDLYAIDIKTRKKHEKLELENWDLNGRIARMTKATIAMSLNLKGGKKDGQQKTSKYGTATELEYINAHPEDFVDFNVPWSLNASYNLTYSQPVYEPKFVNTLRFNGDVKITDKWKVGFSSGYDIENREFTITTLDIYRDLHCWELKFHVIPFGDRQSYRVDLQVKAQILQDLRLTRRREWYDN